MEKEFKIPTKKQKNAFDELNKGATELHHIALVKKGKEKKEDLQVEENLTNPKKRKRSRENYLTEIADKYVERKTISLQEIARRLIAQAIGQNKKGCSRYFIHY